MSARRRQLLIQFRYRGAVTPRRSSLCLADDISPYLRTTTGATTDEKIAAITHHDHYHYAVRESYLLKRREESDVRERIKARFTRVSESLPEILFRLPFAQPNRFGAPIVYRVPHNLWYNREKGARKNKIRRCKIKFFPPYSRKNQFRCLSDLLILTVLSLNTLWKI